MINRLKIVLLISFLAVFFNNQAQVGSPYSQFGIGDNSFRGFEQSKAMGGIGIGIRSNDYLNNLNPASYSAFDSLSVIYALGFNTGFNKIESSIDNVMNTDTRFGYFALGFRASKFWATSFGLTPASRVDYTLKTITNNDVNGNIDTYLHGSGGVNKVYWSNAFKINDNLSLGITASYLFGAINKVSTVIFADSLTWAQYDNTKIDKQLNINGLTFDFGIQYKFDLKNSSKLILGAVYESKMSLNSKQSILAGTVRNVFDPDASYYKGIYNDQHGSELITTAIDTQDIKGTITLPHAFGFGFTYNMKEKLLIGADVYTQMWSKITNSIYDASFNDLLTFRGGLEFTPDNNSINHYFKRVHYRFGGHYTQSHLEIKNTRINDYGLSFGIGLPLRNTKTSFNISFELGQRGTTEQYLLRETYGMISLNISLSDIWFVKRKFK